MKDLQIFFGNKPYTRVNYAIGAKSITGKAKVVHKFASIFLSDEKYGVGTNFMTKLRSGAVRTSAALVASFTTARVAFTRQLEQVGLPKDETISRVELTAFEFLADKIYLTIKVVTADEAETTFGVAV